MRKATPLLLLSALLGLAQQATARFGFPEPLTERGQTVHEIYVQIFIAGALVFIIVFILLVLVLYRFREGSGHGGATFEHERGHMGAEAGWTIVPLIIVLWVGWISYQGLIVLDDEFDEDQDAFMELHVTGVRYAWIADYEEFDVIAVYPDHVKAENHIVVPADVPIRINLTADEDDVLHAMNILDENHAYVWLLDANTRGPQKYSDEVITFPAGEYFVQCKEHCFNPGHAYMRAVITAMPMDEYNEWFEAKKAGAGAGLVQQVSVTASDSGLATGDLTKLAQGATAMLTIDNTAGSEQTFTFGNASVTIAAGSSDAITAAAAELGTMTLSADVGSLAFDVITPQTIDVDLGDFFIDPDSITLTAGELYLVNVENVGAALHNLYVGAYAADNSRVDVASANIAGGATTAVLIAAQEPVSLDTWCNIPGHYSAGMSGSLTVS